MRQVTEEQVAGEIAARFTLPRIVASGNFATPKSTLAAIDSQVDRYSLFALNGQFGFTHRDGVVLETPFVGPGMRGSEHVHYVPARLSLVPALFRQLLPPDVVVVHASAPIDGKISLGIEVNILPAAIEQARRRGGVVVAQVNRHMPYTLGDGEYDITDFDYVVEVDEPLAEPTPPVPDEQAQQIGERLAGLVDDGSTLQTGIGAVPNAALDLMTTKRELRIWSEMFSDGALTLAERGALDMASPLVASFVFGTRRFYDWIDRNSSVRILRTETTNDPLTIARNPRVVSINTALQVDLFGQVNASRIGQRIHSGFGGQTDFIVGALHSHGGRAIIALRSWHPKADVSTIVGLLEQPVTSFQPSAVVTEHGVAWLWGHNEREQAMALINHAAHPRARAQLRSRARQLGLATGESALQ